VTQINTKSILSWELSTKLTKEALIELGTQALRIEEDEKKILYPHMSLVKTPRSQLTFMDLSFAAIAATLKKLLRASV
jgi:hypothetical protein